jgi:transposase
MLYENNYIEKLLGIKGVSLKNIEENNTSITISFELEVKDHTCPCCGNKTRRIHDYRTQIIKEAPMFGKHTYYKYRKRRYVCSICNKKFYEYTSFAPRYHRMTSRLVSLIIEKMRSTHSMKSIAEECNVSVNTITRVFNYVNYSFRHLPVVLSIDEFKGNVRIDIINELIGTHIESEDFDTIAGFVIGIIDRLPEAGEEIEYENIRFIIENIDRNRIKKIRILT